MPLTGRDAGPDLTHLSSRLTSAQVLEAILTPSKTITQGYQAITAKIKDCTSQVGFVVKRDGDVFGLKTAVGDVLNLPRDQVFSEIPLPASLMPEGQFQAFTAQEAADLLSYLLVLK